MHSLVIYVSHKGNTRRIAQAVGEALSRHGVADVLAIDEAPRHFPAEVDLLVVGGPTEGHGMTPDLRTGLDRLDPAALRGRPAAAFDTRLNWPRMLSGSAADGIARWLAEAGALVREPVGSFLVSMEPALLAGELERAGEWAESLVAQPIEATRRG